MTASDVLTISTIVAALALTLGVLRYSRRLSPLDTARPQVRFLGTYSPVITRLSDRRWLSRPMEFARQWWRALPRASLLELAAIALWAVWVGRVYLDFNSLRWPAGADWALNIEGYFPWTWLSQCGVCVLWNGSINGGAPAFVDLVASVLHPVWIVSILLFGVVNASKVAILAGLVMAGWAQWWLAKTLRLGGIARLWSAALVVVGGHLAGRLAGGLVELLFPIGAASLAIAAAVDLAVTGRRRAVALLGITTGLSVLSGLAYIPIGLILCVFPGLIFFLTTSHFQRRPVFKSFVVAGVIAALISAILWVPLFHFLPNFIKETGEPGFPQAQPLEQLIINLVIPNASYYQALSDAGRPGYAEWFASYIGWLPLLLAALGWRAAPKRWLRLVAFALSGIILTYLMGSALLLKWLVPVAPTQVLSMRTPSFISDLAVPLILLLAAIGLDALWHLNWPTLLLRSSIKTSRAISLRWVLLVPLLWSVRSAYQVAEQYMNLGDIPKDFYVIFSSKGLAAKQWVALPFGESGFTVIGLQAGLKLTSVGRPWYWRDHTAPPAHGEFTRQQPVGSQQTAEFGLYFVDHPDSNYATVTQPAGSVPCDATAVGGNIDVTCDSTTDGVLVVKENAWSGWWLWRDGVSIGLIPGQWLSTSAPAGRHHYAFRYWPWDVVLGGVMTITGVIWVLRLLLKRRPTLPGHVVSGV